MLCSLKWCGSFKAFQFITICIAIIIYLLKKFYILKNTQNAT
uniref:Uncharacterized protein n=1 Tax=uncultured Desulfobacterium sp. TaxID=201089 RepID=E1Y814_9BACT|nr:unknown protein [uncultured Desulfobacterium sp.]